MNFWNSLVSIVDNTARRAQQGATQDAPVKIENVDVGSVVPIGSLDGELFAASCVSVDAQGNSTVGERVQLAVTRTQILELTNPPQLFTNNQVLVKEAHPLEALHKLKFRKGLNGKLGLLMLTTKSGADIQYVLKDPLPAVTLIRTRMSALGISGNVTKSSMQLKDLKTAREYLDRAEEIEAQFMAAPTLGLARDMLDLLRMATEKFAAANDLQYQQVNDRAQQFLGRPDVLALLDEATPMKSSPQSQTQISPVATFVTPYLVSVSDRTSEKPLITPAVGDFHTPLPILQQEWDESALEAAVRYSDDFDDEDQQPQQSEKQSSLPLSSRSGRVGEDVDKLDHFLQHIDSEFEQLLQSFQSQSVAVAQDVKEKRNVGEEVTDSYSELVKELELPDFDSVFLDTR